MAAALKLEFYRIFECSCRIEFRNISSTDKELYAMAFCKECPGEVEYQSFSNRNMLRIMVQKFDFNKEHSNKKTKLTGILKTKVVQLLEASQPGIVQAKLAADMISNFSNQSTLVPHKRGLRQIKYREGCRRREFRDKNPVLSICKMKSEAKYYKCIEDVGISPFFVYYTTPLQKVFVKSESRKNTTKISIDATGCSCQLSEEAEISERTGKKKRCFFYNMMLHGKEKTIPVYQMLSQTHSSQKITDWLLTWKNRHNGERNPIEVRMDESAALILSAVTCFTSSKSVHDYLTQCYNHLMNRDSVPRPNCYIRLDRSHVTASLYRNAAFKRVFGKRAGPKSFYLRIIGYLLQEPDIHKATEIIRNTFRMAYNQFSENIEADMLQNLIKIIDTHKNDFDDESQYRQMEDANFWEVKSAMYMYIKRIATEENDLASNNNKDDGTYKVENAYYAEDIVDELIKIFAKLPMSGCLLNNSFGLPDDDVPTSSQVEANFRVVNNDLFAGKRRIGIDRWLETHLNFLIGESKANNTGIDDDVSDEEIDGPSDLFITPPSDNEDINESDINESDTDFSTRSESSYESSCIENEVELESEIITRRSDTDSDETTINKKPITRSKIKTEKNDAGSEADSERETKKDSFDEKVKHENWMGQNDDAKKTNRKLLNRSRMSILSPRGECAPVLPLLKNGFSYDIKSKHYLTTATCSVDSYLQVFFAMYVDSAKFRSLIKSSKDPNDKFIPIIKSAIERKDQQNEAYILRSEFLVSCFNKHCSHVDKSIDSQVNELKSKIKSIRQGKTKQLPTENAEKIETFTKEIQKIDAKRIRKIYFTEETAKVTHLKCETESDTMWRLIMNNSIFYSYIKTNVCKNCAENIIEPVKLPIIPLDYSNAEIEDVQKYLLPTQRISKIKCPKCGSFGQIEYHPSRVILIDSEQFKDNQADMQRKVRPEEISQKIVYNQKRFHLKAVIEGKNGHFVSHIKRPSNEWETYDDLLYKSYKEKKPFFAVKLIYLMDEGENEDFENQTQFDDWIKNSSDISMKSMHSNLTKLDDSIKNISDISMKSRHSNNNENILMNEMKTNCVVQLGKCKLPRSRQLTRLSLVL